MERSAECLMEGFAFAEDLRLKTMQFSGVTMFDEKNVEKKAKIGDRVLYKTTDGYWISGDPEHTEFIPEE